MKTESNRIEYKQELSNGLEKEVITFFHKFDKLFLIIRKYNKALNKYGRTTKYRTQTIVA